jgi:splicing factor 3B subunit 2
MRPDLVEMWDVTAADPKFLVHLKGYRNTVPVPRHWNQKRKYLQVWAATMPRLDMC